MIRIENLLKKYGDTVATDIGALNIDKGEIWGLVGNNGAGKTTLLRLMLDLLKPDRGQIFSDSVPVSKSEHWKEYTGSFIDNNFLIEFLTPKEYFEFIGKIYGMKKDELYEKLSSFSHFFSISQAEAWKYIRKLSSGFKQKTGIVGALLSTPEVLILDEPYNFLDPSSQIILNKILLSSFQNSTKTIILSSHNLKHISDICTRIALMDKGKIIKDVPNTSETMADIEDYFNNQTGS
jgi:ABC-2 type transport system ATP-binding protein